MIGTSNTSQTFFNMTCFYYYYYCLTLVQNLWLLGSGLNRNYKSGGGQPLCYLSSFCLRSRRNSSIWCLLNIILLLYCFLGGSIVAGQYPNQGTSVISRGGKNSMISDQDPSRYQLVSSPGSPPLRNGEVENDDLEEFLRETETRDRKITKFGGYNGPQKKPYSHRMKLSKVKHFAEDVADAVLRNAEELQKSLETGKTVDLNKLASQTSSKWGKYSIC